MTPFFHFASRFSALFLVLFSLCFSTSNAAGAEPGTDPAAVDDGGIVAVCFANVNVAVDASCTALLTPDMIDAGSFNSCGDPVILSLDDPGPYSPGTYTVILEVQSGGETNSCFSTVLVEDKTFPIAVCDAFVNVSLGTDGAFTLTPDMIDAGSTDNCAFTRTITSGPTEFDCSDVGSTYTVVMEIEDIGGNANTCFSDVTITDPAGVCTNQPPVAVCIANVNVSVDASCQALLDPIFIDGGSFDPDGDPLTFSLDDSGPFSPGVYNVNLTVSDGLESSTCFSTITVEDKTNPTAVCINNLLVSIGSGGSTTIFPSDIDGGSTDNCMVNLSFDTGPTVEVDCDDVGSTFNLILVVDDGSGNSSSCTTSVFVDDPDGVCAAANQAPIAVCLNALNAVVGPNCIVEIFPEDVDAGSFDPDGDPIELSIEPAGPFEPGTYNVILNVSDGEFTNECETTLIVSDIDLDGDGVGVCAGDCDDDNETVFPAAPELCDGLDNDCDGSIDEPDNLNTSFEWIERVQLADLDNTSGDDDGYGNYTGLSAALAIDNSYTITLTPGFSGGTFAERWRVYIDLNQNGIFEHPSERVAQVQGTGPQTASITIPAGAPVGATGMRVVMSFNGFRQPCADNFDGEMEDYTVIIDDCENTPGCVNYCEAEAGSTFYEWIQRVRLAGGINNISGDDGGYGDYTGLSATVVSGSSNTMRLRPGFSSGAFLEFWRVWVDWNQDGEFDPVTELAVEESSTGRIITSLEVPLSALPGSTRMRVAMQYNDFAEPCGTFAEGEVEDYTLNILPFGALVEIQDEDLPDAADAMSLDVPVGNASLRTPPSVRTSPTTVQFDLNVYPNPAQNWVNLRLNQVVEAGQVQLLNSNGQQLWTQDWNDDLRIDLSRLQLPSGIYTLRVTVGEQILVRRLLVN
ncbi:MAG: GEVED domain-containing protein [Bacteroidota bacterium]